jgi:hypothetical protein
MGAVEFDPIVSGIRNRVGNFVYSSWKGKNVIRKYNPKRPSATEPQLEVQAAFRVVALIWKMLPEIMQKSWEPIVEGRPLTPFNMFMSKNALKQKNGEIGQLTCSLGIKKLSGYNVVPAQAGEITIKFDPVSEPVHLTVAIQKIVEGVGTADLELRHELPSDTQPVTVNGLESGKEYFIYCMTTDKPFAEAAAISETTGFKVTVV